MNRDAAPARLTGEEIWGRQKTTLLIIQRGKNTGGNTALTKLTVKESSVKNRTMFQKGRTNCFFEAKDWGQRGRGESSPRFRRTAIMNQGRKGRIGFF